jgi:hypothetical protein
LRTLPPLECPPEELPEEDRPDDEDEGCDDDEPEEEIRGIDRGAADELDPLTFEPRLIVPPDDVPPPLPVMDR